MESSCDNSRKKYCTGYTPCVSCRCCPCRCRQTKTELSKNLYYGGTPATSMCHDYQQNEGMQMNAKVRNMLNDMNNDCPSKKAEREYYEKQISQENGAIKPTNVRCLVNIKKHDQSNLYHSKTGMKNSSHGNSSHGDSEYMGYKHCKTHCEPYAKEYSINK